MVLDDVTPPTHTVRLQLSAHHRAWPGSGVHIHIHDPSADCGCGCMQGACIGLRALVASRSAHARMGSQGGVRPNGLPNATTSMLLALLMLALGSGLAADGDGSAPLACFIVRTYWGHGDQWGDRSLRMLLSSLQNQTDPR